MKILMLGWEYPPHIAGGLGTACAGLTSALAQQGVAIHFVVPYMFGDEDAQHMILSGMAAPSSGPAEAEEQPSREASRIVTGETTRIPAFLAPYWNPSAFAQAVTRASSLAGADRGFESVNDEIVKAVRDGEVYGVQLESSVSPLGTRNSTDGGEPYAPSIFSEVERFTSEIVHRFAGGEFDIIHAHDWMTFPAAVALAQITKRPLVVHVHSLEHDRSGFFYDSNIDSIERFGLQSADRIIAVSHYTKRSIEHHHYIPHSKISVVHNGIYPRQVVNDYRHRKTWPQHVVLFLGRVTFQKGPEYFVEVASKVIPHVRDVVFVLAGSGDMLPQVKDLVRQKALDAHFLFPGFVQGEELEELFSVADLYVMPSVSEPFGITALEAISFETPVVLSKQSGAAEVLRNIFKADFWDTDKMADIIINTLTHPELRDELVRNASEELAKLHWDVAAAKSVELYRELLAVRPAVEA